MLQAPKPRARSSPMMAVVGNTLWLYGGTVEVGSYNTQMQLCTLSECIYAAIALFMIDL